MVFHIRLANRKNVLQKKLFDQFIYFSVTLKNTFKIMDFLNLKYILWSILNYNKIFNNINYMNYYFIFN